jgi:membrane protein implicated in regulation of membrane protease activity
LKQKEKYSKIKQNKRGEINMNSTIIWLLILLVLVVIEITTLGLYTIWFAGGALAATITAAFHGPFWLQLTLFLLVSITTLFFTRPIVVKYFNKDRIKTNVDSLIGSSAVVISDIDNIHQVGQVVAGGQEWTARSSQDDILLETGKIVTILSVSGVKLIVKERKEEM